MSSKIHSIGPGRLFIPSSSISPQTENQETDAQLDISVSSYHERVLKAPFGPLDSGDSAAAGFVGSLRSDLTESQIEQVILHYAINNFDVGPGSVDAEAKLTVSNRERSNVTTAAEAPPNFPSGGTVTSSDPPQNQQRYEPLRFNRCNNDPTLGLDTEAGDLLIFEAYLTVTSNQDGTEGSFEWRVQSVEVRG